MLRNIEKSKGITLIALIITIIVLLILAGVSIASITGDNGVLNKANKARVETDKATAREQIQLETIASYETNGSIDIDKLKNNLKNNLGIAESNIVDTDGDFPLTVTYKGYNFTIDEDGNVTKAGTQVTPDPTPDPEPPAVEEPIAPEDVATGGTTFTRANGQIEIEFLTGTSYTTGNANAPLIDDETEKLVPVNWNGTNWVVTDQAGWDYSYGTTDSTKKWANVMLRDTLVLNGMTNAQVQGASIADMKGKTVTTEGSMLVWLPRYAYRIVYFDTPDNEVLYRTGTLTETAAKTNGSIVGYSDARGLVDKTGATPTGMDTPVTSIAVGEKLLRPHPAFETELSQGGWSTRLTGIWMGKFEATTKVNNKITIRPNTASYTNQTIGTFYTDAQNLGIANSHMAKNSEWGAMAYLTESKYGRNGVAVTKNSAMVNSKITTGQGDYKTNIAQSTTGNVYGIYDTVGGSFEYVASYIADNSQTYGNSFASINSSASGAKNDKTDNTPFSTVYTMSASNSYTENYTFNINKIFGDAIIETSTAGAGSTSWYSTTSAFVGIYFSDNHPFFCRGGWYNYANAGSFDFYNSDNGYGTSYFSFRVCASVQ